MEREIYERIYDNPIDKDGNNKPNRKLGKFKVIQQIFEDFYSEEFIGEMDGEKYLIRGIEVSGMYNPEKGGVRYEVNKYLEEEINNLKN